MHPVAMGERSVDAPRGDWGRVSCNKRKMCMHACGDGAGVRDDQVEIFTFEDCWGILKNVKFTYFHAESTV